MNKDTSQSTLLSLLLAYFAPIYFSSGKFTLKTAMVSTYARLYIKRSILGALVTFSVGELLCTAEYAILGAIVTGLFIVFAGLCGVFLVALYDTNRNLG